MLPVNLHSLSDGELVNLIESSTDPLIQELVRRLKGLSFEDTIHELELQIETLGEDNLQAERDLEVANERVAELENLLREHKIEVPV